MDNIKHFRNRDKRTFAQYSNCPKCGKKGKYTHSIHIRTGSQVQTIGYITLCRFCKYVFNEG